MKTVFHASFRRCGGPARRRSRLRAERDCYQRHRHIGQRPNLRRRCFTTTMCLWIPGPPSARDTLIGMTSDDLAPQNVQHCQRTVRSTPVRTSTRTTPVRPNTAVVLQQRRCSRPRGDTLQVQFDRPCASSSRPSDGHAVLAGASFQPTGTSYRGRLVVGARSVAVPEPAPLLLMAPAGGLVLSVPRPPQAPGRLNCDLFAIERRNMMTHNAFLPALAALGLWPHSRPTPRRRAWNISTRPSRPPSPPR